MNQPVRRFIIICEQRHGCMHAVAVPLHACPGRSRPKKATATAHTEHRFAYARPYPRLHCSLPNRTFFCSLFFTLCSQKGKNQMSASSAPAGCICRGHQGTRRDLACLPPFPPSSQIFTRFTVAGAGLQEQGRQRHVGASTLGCSKLRDDPFLSTTCHRNELGNGKQSCRESMSLLLLLLCARLYASNPKLKLLVPLVTAHQRHPKFEIWDPKFFKEPKKRLFAERRSDAASCRLRDLMGTERKSKRRALDGPDRERMDRRRTGFVPPGKPEAQTQRRKADDGSGGARSPRRRRRQGGVPQPPPRASHHHGRAPLPAAQRGV